MVNWIIGVLRRLMVCLLSRHRLYLVSRPSVRFLCAGLLFVGSLAHSSLSFGFDAREHIETAKSLIEEGQYSFARSYLNPAVIAPFISPSVRAHAYYLRGFSFGAQDLHVSALRDYNRALEFAPDNGRVLCEVGFAYATGRGVAKDEAVAFEYFERAATRGDAEGYFRKGYALLHGAGVEKNLPAAREALSQAAAQDHNFAMLTLAGSYRAPHVAQPQSELAKQWYERAHAAGIAQALWYLGYMYEHGEFGQVELDRAAQLYRQALEEGVAVAGVNLGYAYLTGAGVEADETVAFEFYEQAAAANVSSGQLGLAHMYEHGLGVAADEEQAITLYEMSANQGNVSAMGRLVSYYLSKATREDRARALSWSAKAAASGRPQAQNDYAWLLATSKFDELRNGTLALSTAQAAVAQSPTAAYLDTLAAAYAELGDFDAAIEAQQRALDALDNHTVAAANVAELATESPPARAVQAGEVDRDHLSEETRALLQTEFEARLKLYQTSQPWRE